MDAPTPKTAAHDLRSHHVRVGAAAVGRAVVGLGVAVSRDDETRLADGERRRVARCLRKAVVARQFESIG